MRQLRRGDTLTIGEENFWIDRISPDDGGSCQLWLGRGDVYKRQGCTHAESFILISSGETETITIGFSYVSAVIFTLILSSKVQAIDQTKDCLLYTSLFLIFGITQLRLRKTWQTNFQHI